MPKVNFVKIGLKFHQNWLYYLSETRVFAKDRLRFSCWGLVILHWNDQINMLLSHLGEMTKLSHAAVYQWNDTMHMLCHILVKCRDLRTLSHLAEMSRFTRFVAFSRNVVIYALCRILVKCRDLRIFPGKKIRIPGTKNYYGGLLRARLMFATFCFQHMSLHIQAPKKDPDYEEEDNNMGLCLFDNDLGDLWPLTHLKKPHSWCVQILSEKYIFQNS